MLAYTNRLIFGSVRAVHAMITKGACLRATRYRVGLLFIGWHGL